LPNCFIFLCGTNCIMTALRLCVYDIEYDQHQLQTSIPYSEGGSLHSLNVFISLYQIRSDIISTAMWPHTLWFCLDCCPAKIRSCGFHLTGRSAAHPALGRQQSCNYLLCGHAARQDTVRRLDTGLFSDVL
jgi:hypothetical protein